MNLTRFKLFLLIASAILFSNCGPNHSENVEQIVEHKIVKADERSFEIKKKVYFNKTDINIEGQVMDLVVVDTFLLAVDLKANPMVHVIGINSNKYLGKIINRGRGPGELLQVSDILDTSETGLFWVYDISLGKFMKINVIDALSSGIIEPELQFEVGEKVRGAKSPQCINDSIFASLSYAFDDCRFILFNTKSKIIDKVGELPEASKSWPKQNEKAVYSLAPTVYNGLLTSTDIGSNAKIAVGYLQADRIEIYQDNTLQKIVRGPGFFEPNPKFVDQGGGFMSATHHQGSIYGHVRIKGTTKNIYTIYSGSNSWNGDKITVFDWSGNPKKILETEHELNCFVPFEKKNQTLIYTIDLRTGDLVTINI